MTQSQINAAIAALVATTFAPLRAERAYEARWGSFEGAHAAFSWKEHEEPLCAYVGYGGNTRVEHMILCEDGEYHPASGVVEVFIDGYEPAAYGGRSCYARYENWPLHVAENGDEGIMWSERRGGYYCRGSQYVELEDGGVAPRCMCVRIDGEYYEADDDRLCCDGHGTYFLYGDDDYVHCEDGESWPTDECYYSERIGEYVHGDPDDEGGPGIIGEYHADKTINFYGQANHDWSGWGVGFEIEKNEGPDGESDDGDNIGETPLFAGWERDASCGIEGITHVYDPISRYEMFHDHVADSRHLIDDSPSDNTCGGHINISCYHLDGPELYAKARRYMGLWYALYRHRLTGNTYVGTNKVLNDYNRHEKYCPVRVATRIFTGIEIRLPGRVANSAQLLRRFDMTALLCKAIDGGWSFNRYVKECRSILHPEVYDRAKFAFILRTARHFNRYLQSGGDAHPAIMAWV
jgi:hypothetical protein